MGAKERYNTIINKIEELAQGIIKDGIVKSIPVRDISKQAFSAANCGMMDDRSKNVLFLFLTNKTVLDYINERKMVAAYKYMIISNEWSRDTIWTAVEMLGLSDEKAFAKKFKKQFGVSPKKAFDNKDYTIITEAMEWDAISEDSKRVFVDFGDNGMVDTKFGISKEKFMIAHTAANLQAFYKLNDVESELAYDLYKQKKIPLEETFEYVYNYIWRYTEEGSEERDSRLSDDLLLPEVIHMYFTCGMSFDDIVNVLISLKKSKLPRNIMDADKVYLKGFAIYSSMPHSEYDYSYEQLYKFYQKHVPKEHDNYITYSIFIRSAKGDGLFRVLEDAVSKASGTFEEDDMTLFFEAIMDNEEYDNDYSEGIWELDFDGDDPDQVEEVWMNHEQIEMRNSIIEEERYFNLFEFEDFCDALDEGMETWQEEDRKIRFYKNLDGEEFFENTNEALAVDDKDELKFN